MTTENPKKLVTSIDMYELTRASTKIEFCGDIGSYFSRTFANLFAKFAKEFVILARKYRKL